MGEVIIFPPGAIRTTEEMRAMLGKPVYLPLPDGVEVRNLRVGPKIIKFHPTHIVPDPPGHFQLQTKEDVYAIGINTIRAREDWSVYWVADPIFFFSNYWFAHAYVQHAENL